MSSLFPGPQVKAYYKDVCSLPEVERELYTWVDKQDRLRLIAEEFQRAIYQDGFEVELRVILDSIRVVEKTNLDVKVYEHSTKKMQPVQVSKYSFTFDPEYLNRCGSCGGKGMSYGRHVDASGNWDSDDHPSRCCNCDGSGKSNKPGWKKREE